MLTNKVVELENSGSETEDVDIFEQSIFTIFAEARNQHGEPGHYVLYKSDVYGDIKLRLSDPDKENNSLFSHFLWNAGVQAAEMITEGEFDVKDQTVVEMGAGAGLPSIISVLAGAKQTVISDYPADEIISNISQNIDTNITSPPDRQRVSVAGHMWGELSDDLCTANPGGFTRVIAADCFWMDWQHDNLSKSIAHLLAKDGGLCLAIAGYHTGRAKVANFFDSAERAGLELVGPIRERNTEGVEREWVRDRGFEDPVERKQWLAIGVFRHKL
ncbi:uncharacterized protein LAJ45_08823 [Morchella importuna]|uniref:uncharacterized protein n=1 Tax=Morchella importuna TaxID=1174673 RepID=UPI001E8D44B5|nr:uncharacterized protein LAJ45_08823 [Morchella importuna]KAH8147024.1 hypothetical protein LAJ45_08823 [Morchella importuna]